MHPWTPRSPDLDSALRCPDRSAPRVKRGICSAYDAILIITVIIASVRHGTRRRSLFALRIALFNPPSNALTHISALHIVHRAAFLHGNNFPRPITGCRYVTSLSHFYIIYYVITFIRTYGPYGRLTQYLILIQVHTRSAAQCELSLA